MTTAFERKHILVIEDDRTLNKLLVDQLDRLGYAARGTASRQESLELLQEYEPALAILDVRLPDSNGLGLLREIREICPVVILTAYGSIEQAVRAIKAGASEYLIKPVFPHILKLTVSRTLETTALKRSARYWQTQASPNQIPNMVGTSAAFSEVRKMIEMIAPADATVLIEGESGVGKELVAKAIHEMSQRRAYPFVAIDCCTFQERAFEAELFGHESGAFAGADSKKEGLIEVAEGGTVFLDEIGEVDSVMQAKLLRVLETGVFRRVGGTRDLNANVRIIAATSDALQDLQNENQLRNDLFYRLSAFTVKVPPLRQRRQDIALIAKHFLVNRKFMRGIKKSFSHSTLKALADHDWPGNVRELQNVVERSVLLSGGAQTILRKHISLPGAGNIARNKVELSFDHEPSLEELRNTYLAHLLEEHGGNRQTVSKILGMSERNTYRLIKKYGLA